MRVEPVCVPVRHNDKPGGNKMKGVALAGDVMHGDRVFARDLGDVEEPVTIIERKCCILAEALGELDE